MLSLALILKCAGLDGAVAKPLANRLVGTEFTSQYWLQPRAGF